VDARSRSCVCGRSLARIRGSIPAWSMDDCLLWVSCCCQVEFFASSWSLIQRSPTHCDVSEYDREASIMRRPWTNGDYCAMEKIKTSVIFMYVRKGSVDYLIYKFWSEKMFHYAQTHKTYITTVVGIQRVLHSFLQLLFDTVCTFLNTWRA
jgi:hypothetical protein